MKYISIFVHSYPPAKGGLEILVSHIHQMLSKNYRVNVFCGHGINLDSYKTFTNYTNKKVENVHRLKENIFLQKIFNKLLNKVILKFPLLSPFYFGPILKYNNKHLNIIKYSDIIIGAGLPTKPVWDAYIFAKKYNKKLVTLPAYHNKTYYNSKLFQLVFNYSKKIVCLSKFEKINLLSNFRILENKIEVVSYSPFKKEEIKQAKSQFYQNKYLNKKTITLGYIGQLSKRKQLSILIDAFKKLSKTTNKYKLLLAGTKTNTTKNVLSALEPSLLKQTELIYDFSEINKSKIYSKIDIFINPSTEESLGISNLEAMYYGIPTLMNKISPLSDRLSGKQLFKSSNDLSNRLNQLENNVKDIDTIIYSHYLLLLEEFNYEVFQYNLLTILHNI